MNSIFFFPIRHHSVSASLALQKYINDLRPSIILIEGPYDFNPKLEELFYLIPYRSQSTALSETNKGFLKVHIILFAITLQNGLLYKQPNP